MKREAYVSEFKTAQRETPAGTEVDAGSERHRSACSGGRVQSAGDSQIAMQKAQYNAEVQVKGHT